MEDRTWDKPTLNESPLNFSSETVNPQCFSKYVHNKGGIISDGVFNWATSLKKTQIVSLTKDSTLKQK